MKRKKVVIVCLILILLSIVVYGTYSLYTGNIDIKNIIKMGNVDLEVIEDKSANNFEIASNEVINKTIKIKNTGNHPLFVRVKVIFKVDNNELNNGEIVLDVDNTKWIYSDGYYYYKEVLDGKSTSDYLFTKIRIDENKVDSSYIDKNFNVKVLAQGVQSENNGDTAIGAFGWPNE